MPWPVKSKHRRMKLWLLIICTFVFSGYIAAQKSVFYSIKNDGRATPEIITSQDAKTINVKMDIEGFSSQTVSFNGLAEKITLHGGIGNMQQGVPDIQHLLASIAINPTGNISLTVKSSEYTDYPSFNIAPSTGDPGLYQTSELLTDTSIYNTNAFWPSTLAELSEPYIIGSIRGVSVHFYPVQYNPVTQVLRVYHHIEVAIESLDEIGRNELTRLSPNSHLLTNGLTGDHFINEIPSMAADRYAAINEEQGRMLIIAHPSFIESMQPFVKWKNQKGIKCEMVDVTSIGGSEQIKLYVSEYYYTNGLTFLLLVGDEAYVPSCQAAKGLSDITYGYIAGDDHYPEVLVGRFPCETTEHCRIMVARTINYEKNPPVNASYNSFLGIGSGLGPGDDGELDFEHIRNIGTSLSPSIYKTFSELYDGSRGGNDLNGNPTTSQTAESINKGQGAIMYIGHGSINSWLTTGFSTKDAYSLENTETHPFIWAAGCNSGQFNDATCLAEGFLRASKDGQPTGAIAALMSSAVQTWYPPMEAQDEIAQILRDKNNVPLSFGGISFSGCMKMNDKYGKGAYVITDNWILFGDPSVELRTSSPKEFNPVFDSIIGTDATQLIINSLPDGAFVCLTENNNILATSYAHNGVAEPVFNNISSAKSLTITITGRNYRPIIAEIRTTNLPSQAIEPSPVNHSYKVPVATKFNWKLSTGCAPEYFVWSIRKKGEENWQNQIITNLNDHVTPKLEYLTEYEWKVTSFNENGSAESRIFDFTTIEAPDEDFEQGNFPRSNWSNSESWYVDNSEAYEGNFSLHSGNSISRESSSLFYECETKSCDFISFWLKQNILSQNASLSFYMDDFLVARWNNTINWTNFTYQIEPGYHKFEWRFNDQPDSISGCSAAWIDNIYLPENEPLSVSSLTHANCPVTSIQLQPNVRNYASLRWESTGGGYFDDPDKLYATYFPSKDELLSQTINLQLVVVPNSVCQTSVYDYMIELYELPEFDQLHDTTLYSGEGLSIEPGLNSSSQYVIYSDNSTSSTMDIDITKLTPGENLLTVVAENSNGCQAEKQFTITLIPSARPSNSTLTVYPNPSSDYINIVDTEKLSTVRIYRSDGQLVGLYDNAEGYGMSIPVNQLEPGIYLISAESSGQVSTSRFIKI